METKQGVGDKAMFKRILILLLILVLNLLIVLSLHPYMQNIEDNSSFNNETNAAIKTLVQTMLRIQYRWHFEGELEKLFTDECRQNMPRGFYNKEWFYFFDSDYMKTLEYSRDNELYLIVRVGGLFSDECDNIVKLIQKPDGTYIISDIGFDP